jgi:prepilin-type N-terminal cleavage/methylation domain-containing protein/prepilin-type processing-associated H-X9-DG protein
VLVAKVFMLEGRAMAEGVDVRRDRGLMLPRGFTLVELLVVIAIIGVLVALLLPAVQAARESARRMSCSNHLRQIALAIHNFSEARGALAPRKATNASSSPTWAVLLLPYLEQSAGYELWDLKKDHSNQFNNGTEQTDAARQVFVPVYTCPTRRSGKELSIMEAGQSGPAGTGGQIPERHKPGRVGDYAGNVGTFGQIDPSGQIRAVWFTTDANGALVRGVVWSVDDPLVRSQVRWASISDGTSNTFLLGEKHVPKIGLYHVNYGDSSIYNGYWVPYYCRLAGLEDPLGLGPHETSSSILGDSQWARKFGSWHPGVCNFAFCDGSVRFVRNTLDATTLERLARRADGLAVNYPD